MPELSPLGVGAGAGIGRGRDGGDHANDGGAAMTPVTVSWFASLYDKRIARRELLDWRGFCSLFTPERVKRVPVARLAWDSRKRKWAKPSAGVPMLSPAAFRADEGAPFGYQDEAHHEASTAVGLDYDAACDEHVDAVVERVTSAVGARCIVHSTFNYTPERPAFRVLLHPTRHLRFAEYARVVKALCARLDGKAASSVCDGSRLWYGPTCPEDAEYHVRFVDGPALDVDSVLATAPAAEATRTRRGAPLEPAALPTTIGLDHPEFEERFAWFVDVCRMCTPPRNGGETFAIASRGTRSAELPADAVLLVLKEVLRPRCDAPVPDDEWWKVERLVGRTVTHGTFEPGTARSEIAWRRFIKQLETKGAAANAPALWSPPAPTGPAPAPWKAPRRQKGAAR